ncbi:hypothetical protein [Streptacidiphilus sp. EB129]|jgi:hypothetical protein|uniref:hypothetical protein n=1 Tax=Streptacidiphilus sp. EB129 TaxID=3156262 RepID=UPI003511D547
MGLLELFSLPAIMALLVLAFGGFLALAPRRSMAVIGNGFGFDVDFRVRGPVKGLCTRAVGLVLTGYGLYLLLNTVRLWHSFHLG